MIVGDRVRYVLKHSSLFQHEGVIIKRDVSLPMAYVDFENASYWCALTNLARIQNPLDPT